MAGELYIAGAAVAREYWNRPQLTPQAFLPDPFVTGSDECMYRSGDICRVLPDGNLEFLGRRDDQVKIQGVRIELGEIQFALTQLPGVAEAYVRVMPLASSDPQSPANQQIVAYVSTEDHRLTDFEMTSSLKRVLPSVMLPAAYVRMDRLPTTLHGKVDVRQLPLPEPADAHESLRLESPATETEQWVLEETQAVLQLKQLSLDANFFSAGGHSMLAVRLAHRLRERLALAQFPVASVFAFPTVRQLAQHIDSDHSGGLVELLPRHGPLSSKLPPNLVRLRPEGSQPALFCIHGLGGHVVSFVPLARQLSVDRGFYALQGNGIDGRTLPDESIATMADRYTEAIRSVQAAGPYLLSGWSMGGLIALEVANCLIRSGESVASLIMLDTHLSVAERALQDVTDESIMRQIAPRIGVSLDSLKRLALSEQWNVVQEQVQRSGIDSQELELLARVCQAHLAALAGYAPRSFEGQAFLLRAGRPVGRLDRRWQQLCPNLRVERVQGSHYSMLAQPDVVPLAKRLSEILNTPGLSS